MKSRTIRLALLSAFALTAPLLPFAGSQNNQPQTPDNAQTQNVQDATPVAVQQGPDSGVTRADLTLRAEAPPVETPAEPACVQEGKHTCPRWDDSAFHK
jgi:hypothetical protein